jgi:hypothetical protein
MRAQLDSLLHQMQQAANVCWENEEKSAAAWLTDFALALDTILNDVDGKVMFSYCSYCSCGQKAQLRLIDGRYLCYACSSYNYNDI